jgi:geranylgeranyl reductase family protein
MTRVDAVIVGGGPAGSTCAGALRRSGWNVLVVDRARFPRDKVCAGWLTPHVFAALDLSPSEYRAAGLTLQPISAFRTGVIGSSMVETRYAHVVSYGILRREFDHFLLRRADVRVLDNTPVETLRRTDATWIVNDAVEAPVLIGAGGHFCPVARHLRGGRADAARPIVAKEAEFPSAKYASGAAAGPPSLYFCRDLDGYGWCVPKGDYVNVGIGRRDSRDFSTHVRDFIALLEAHHIHAGDAAVRWHGHAYFASGTGPRPLVDRGVLLIGDAAGLAFPESGEGIRPAIESGLLAAQTLIAARGRHGIEDLLPYGEAVRSSHPPAPRATAGARAVSTMAGRFLLRSPGFTRHVLLQRWFLRAHDPRLSCAAARR